MQKTKKLLFKQKNIFTHFSLGLATVLLSIGSFVPLYATDAGDIRSQLETLDGSIEASEQRVNELQNQANTLQERLSAMAAEEKSLERDIENTEQEVSTIQQSISEKEQELERKKELLQENARIVYKEGDPSTIEILFSSGNFTDFINRQEYLSSAKDNLNNAAISISEIKQDLEEQETELEEKLNKLEGQKAQLLARQQEQRELLESTRGEEARFQKQLERDREEYRQAQQQLEKITQCASQGGVWNESAGECRFTQQSQVRINGSTTVNRGDAIALMGSSGASTGPHIHFEVRSNGNELNPGNGSGLNYGYSWPVQGRGFVTQPYGCVGFAGFGYYPSGPCPAGQFWHNGLDIGSALGTPILAAESGRVVFNGWLTGYGYTIMIQHGDGRTTLYAHLCDNNGNNCWRKN